MMHRLTTDYAKKCCNQTLIAQVILENVVTCFFLEHSVSPRFAEPTRAVKTCHVQTQANKNGVFPDSPKPDSPKLGFRVRVSISAKRVSANRD